MFDMGMLDKIYDRQIMTPTEVQLARFIREHIRDVVEMSLDDLADKLFISRSTILRFYKKLGVNGHKEFCLELAKEINTVAGSQFVPSSSVPFELYDDRKSIADKLETLQIHALNDTIQNLNLEEVNKAAKFIRERKKIFIYALEENYLMASDFQFKLQSIGYFTYGNLFPGMVLANSKNQPNDSIGIFISYYENDQILNQAAALLSEKRIPIILIGGPTESTLDKLATVRLKTAFYEQTPKIGSFGSRNAILYILDLLYAYLFQLDYEKNMNQLKNK